MKIGGRRQSLRAISVNLTLLETVPENESVDDLLFLSSLEESDLIRHIEGRFRRNLIYTKAGPVMISMNPFCIVTRSSDNLSIYSEKILREYVQDTEKSKLKSLNVSGEFLPPHIFSVASAAFSLLENEDQAILISGESGAGKTEATKHCLTLLASAKRLQHSSENSVNTGLAQRLLDVNPVLEALGNAMTSRNNNSSRFGKWMEITFNGNKEVMSARVTQFLLEKSRLTNQSPQERSFHIFYYMCYGTSQQERDTYQIFPGIESYRYFVKTSRVRAPAGTDHPAMWREFLECLRSIGCQPTQVDQVIRIISGIMLLGNVSFVMQTEGVTADGPIIEKVADLFGIASYALQNAITTREITVAKKSTIVNLSLAESESSREGFAKNFYCRLFDWVVSTINKNLADSDANTPLESDFVKRNIVGLLDIFGFENFDSNSFEQLCINYANEKLHQHYIKHIIKSEFQLFEDEGIQYEFITFGDNKLIIDLIEDPTVGVFAILNDKSMMVVQGTDESLSTQLDKTHSSNGCYRPAPPSKRGQCFTIRHSPADIVYLVSGFVEKNKDKLQKLIETALMTSTHSVIRQIFCHDQDGDSGPPKEIVGKKALLESFASYKFSQDIKSLVSIVERMNPHFVRCIKSNNSKLPMTLDLELVLHQFRYLGIIDLCNIRTRGFFFRDTYKNVCMRYKDLIFGRFSAEGKSVSELRKAVEDMLVIVIKPPVLPAFISKMLLRRGATELAENVMNQVRKNRNQGSKPASRLPFQKDTAILNMKQEIQYGKTRVFLRRAAYDMFEEALDKRLDQFFYSASMIQSHIRCYMQSFIYKATIIAQRLIMYRIKGSIYRKRFHKLKKLSLFISSKFRMMAARQGYVYMYGRVVKIQKAWRRHRKQDTIKMIKRAILFLRPRIRMVFSKAAYLKTYRTGKIIADWVFDRHAVRKRYKAVDKIAACYLKYKTYKKFAQTHKPIINYLLIKRRERLVRRVARRFKTYCATVGCRRQFLKMRSSAIMLQRRIRCWIAHNRISRFYRSTRCIQKIVRGVQLRVKLMRIFRYVARIEGWYLTLAMRKRFKTIQKASIDVKNWWKQILERKKFVALRLASMALQKWIRGKFAVRKFQNLVTNLMLEKELSNCRKTELDSLRRHLRSSFKGVRVFDIDVATSLVDCYGHTGFIQSIQELDTEFISSSSASATDFDVEIFDVQIGFSHCLCLTSDGNVWQKSEIEPDWEAIPFEIDSRPLMVLRIASGESHSIAICANNLVFGWGNNSRGQVGIGSQESLIDSPQLIRNLTLYMGEFIIKICAGAMHSHALSDLGLIYSWGVNTCLGIGLSSDLASPARISFFSQIRVADISCGLNFSVACGDDGNVYCWGNNKHNQVGKNSKNKNGMIQQPILHQGIKNITQLVLPSSNAEKLPRRKVGSCDFVKSKKFAVENRDVQDNVIAVSCGAFHSAAVTQSGRVLTWGRNESGQLGVKKYDRCSDSWKTEEPLENVRVLQAACGLRQTFCVSSEGKVYAFGKLFALSGGNNSRGRDIDTRNFVPENCLPPKPAMFNMDESGRIMLALNSGASMDTRRNSFSDTQLKQKSVPLAIKVVWSRAMSFVCRTDKEINKSFSMSLLQNPSISQKGRHRESWIDANHLRLQRQLGLTDRQLHIMLTSGNTTRFLKEHEATITKHGHAPEMRRGNVQQKLKPAKTKQTSAHPLVDMLPHFDRRVILRSIKLERLRAWNKLDRKQRPWKIIQQSLVKSFKSSDDDIAIDSPLKHMLMQLNPIAIESTKHIDDNDAKTETVESQEQIPLAPKTATKSTHKPGRKALLKQADNKVPIRSGISEDFLKMMVGDSASQLSESRSLISELRSIDNQKPKKIVFGSKLSTMVSGHVKKVSVAAVAHPAMIKNAGATELTLEGLVKSRQSILSNLPQGIAYDWESKF